MSGLGLMKSQRGQIPWRKAHLAVRRRVQILDDKHLNSILGYAVGSLAEAYRIGAEEMQGEMIKRIDALRPVARPAYPETVRDTLQWPAP